MTKHCSPSVYCHWMACLNPKCDIRFADMNSGRTTKKTRDVA
jgi:hypothetical protein